VDIGNGNDDDIGDLQGVGRGEVTNAERLGYMDVV
jgi:hypothetical protein